MGGGLLGTLVLAVLIIASAVIVDAMSAQSRANLVQDLGFDQDAFLGGRWWVIVISPFVQPNPGLALRFWTMSLTALASAAYIERRLGHWVPIAVFFGTHIASVFLTLGVLKLLALLGSNEAERLLTEKDTGVSAAVAGLVGFALALVRDRRVTWLWGGLVIWVVWGFSRYRMDTALAHAAAVLVGVAAGLAARPGEERDQ